MERKYFISGFMNNSHKIYDNLDDAVNHCKKINKRVKNKRYVMSGIPTGGSCYTDTKIEYKE